MTEFPSGMSGMRHIALRVERLAECVCFYRDILGMKVDWQPDEDNCYLTSGSDNLALHRADSPLGNGNSQRLDHLGFVLSTMDDVDAWHAHFIAKGVEIISELKTHRDGARSFYCKDPDGNTVQMICL